MPSWQKLLWTIKLVAAITVDSVEDLNLVPGDKVTALVKATEMMVLK
ncbi:TOBE domain-containing protein [Sporomusa malonica]|nr:TOBE domain-containing protein [Sporomusa malonica]